MIDLRKERIDEHWRRLFKRKYKLSLENISYTGNHLFGDFEAVFSNGLTCIVGKNGIGKSTFIRSIHNAFHSEGSNRDIFKINTIQEGEVQINVNREGNIAGFTTSIGSKISENIVDPITSFLFDPCSTIPSLQQMLLDQDNFHELLEGYQVKKFTSEELKIINYLTGNIYTEVSLVVIEDEFETFSSFPYFKVNTSSSNYDSRNMGLGELSLFYFFWLVNYIHKFDGHKLLLVEEPESFLPPLAQEKLANILAKSISEYGVSCILSTHSEHLLKRVPRNHILIFQKIDTKLTSRIASDKFEHLQTIGLAAPKVGLLLFEDSAAILFFKTIIKFSKEFVPDRFYYHHSGSEGDIISDLKRLPSLIEGFRIIGVFDGDCNSRDLKLPETALWTYLPTSLSPEEIIIKFIEKLDKDVLASYFTLNITKLNDALETVIGGDRHNYLEVLAKELDIPYAYLFSKICEKWCELNDNESALNNFLIDFNSKIE
jgi:predicted ATPase